MTKFVLCLCRGEYDDYLSIPILITDDVVSAQLIRDAIENKEPEYFSYVKNYLVSTSEPFTIDIEELPYISF